MEGEPGRQSHIVESQPSRREIAGAIEPMCISEWWRKAVRYIGSIAAFRALYNNDYAQNTDTTEAPLSLNPCTRSSLVRIKKRCPASRNRPRYIMTIEHLPTVHYVRCRHSTHRIRLHRHHLHRLATVLVNLLLRLLQRRRLRVECRLTRLHWHRNVLVSRLQGHRLRRWSVHVWCAAWRQERLRIVVLRLGRHRLACHRRHSDIL